MNGSRCLSDNECRNSAQVIIEMSKFGKVTADIEGYTFYWTRCRWLFWNWKAFLCCTGSVLKLTVGMQWQFVVAESVLRVTTSGKPGNVRKFHSCKKNVRKLGFKVGNCRSGGILSSKLFIAKFRLVATTVFSWLKWAFVSPCLLNHFKHFCPNICNIVVI